MKEKNISAIHSEKKLWKPKKGETKEGGGCSREWASEWWKATQINLFQSICQALVLLFCYLDWMFYVCFLFTSVFRSYQLPIYLFLYNQFRATVRALLINVFVLRQYWLSHDVFHYFFWKEMANETWPKARVMRLSAGWRCLHRHGIFFSFYSFKQRDTTKVKI